MTLAGIIVLWLINICLLAWIFSLSRRGKLYIGYAVVWLVWSIFGLVVVSIPPVLNFITMLVGARFPASALTMLAFAFLFVMQIYILSQLSILSRRISLISQTMAIGAQKHSDNPISSDDV
jgi:hypothetical protein